jgi:hypothetical protein
VTTATDSPGALSFFPPNQCPWLGRDAQRCSKEMLISFCDSKGILASGMTAAETAKMYPVGFADIANRVQAAAGMYFYILYF